MAGEVAPLIEAFDLSVSRGGQQVLREIAFRAHPGDWFGILGVNGSGKTTLLQSLAGRLPIDEGKLVILAEDDTYSEARRSAKIGFAPSPESLPALLTVGELLALVAQMRGVSPGTPNAIFAALGIERLSRQRIDNLSMGERQRVSVSLAFVGEPRIVVLDEPFNWLDPVAAFDLKDVLSELLAHGLLLVTALHDISTFAQRCSAGLWLHGGQVAQHLHADDLRAARADSAAFERRIYDLFRG